MISATTINSIKNKTKNKSDGEALQGIKKSYHTAGFFPVFKITQFWLKMKKIIIKNETTNLIKFCDMTFRVQMNNLIIINLPMKCL